MRISLPLLLLKLLRFLSRFCSSFFSSSSLLPSSVLLLLLLLLRVVVGVFPSSSAFSFAVSLPSCISVLRSRTTKAREEKSLSKILSSSVIKLSLSLKSPFLDNDKKVLSFFLSLETRANASAVWWLKQSPTNPLELP